MTTAGAFALAVAAQPALAADLPGRAPAYKAPVAAPIFNWTGFYAGGQLGYGWGSADMWEIFTPLNEINNGPFPYTARGFIGGGHLGYRTQYNSIVLGLVADLEASNIKGLFHPFQPSTYDAHKKISWMGSVRANLGVAVDRLHLYATGGLALGRVKMDLVDIVGAQTFAGSETAIGYTVGAGVEHAMTNSTSGWIEYRYTDLGKTDHPTFGGGDFADRHSNKFHAVRAGVSWKFATGKAPGPVITKY